MLRVIAGGYLGGGDGGFTVTALADMTGGPRYAVTRTVHSLVSKGLVAGTPGALDGAESAWAPTAEGLTYFGTYLADNPVHGYRRPAGGRKPTIPEETIDKARELLKLTDPKTGRRYSQARVAQMLSISPNALQMRLDPRQMKRRATRRRRKYRQDKRSGTGEVT